MNEVKGAEVDSDAAKEFMYTIENIVKCVSLSQSACESHEDGVVMNDSGASVNVCPTWFGEPVPVKSDGSVRLRGADRRTLQDHGKRQIWLRIGSHLRRSDFHVVEGDKTGPECQLRNTPREATLLEARRHDPLIKKSGVYFAKAQIFHQVKGAVEAVMQDEGSRRSCVRKVTCTSWWFTKFTKVVRASIRFTELMCAS